MKWGQEQTSALCRIDLSWQQFEKRSLHTGMPKTNNVCVLNGRLMTSAMFLQSILAVLADWDVHGFGGFSVASLRPTCCTAYGAVHSPPLWCFVNIELGI